MTFLTPAGRVIVCYLSAGLLAYQIAFGSGAGEASEAKSCRCAVLYSGHVRSFAQPRVYQSHKKHLIEQLEIDCHVDVFMYISVKDEVPLRHRMGDFGDALAFTPHSPEYTEVELAVGLLNPVSIEFHQEQAGFIPNGCETSCELNAYWQLYKMKAVYNMMEGHEAASELPYTWVIRSRLDIAWMLPLPPLSQFSPTRVYAGHNFFPLADFFLLLPRRFAQTVFGAVSLCYDCEALQAQRESMIPAQTESLLRVALRRDSNGGNGMVPFGYYEFPVVIVRNNEGGVCDVLHPHKFTCEMLRASGLMDPFLTTTTGYDDDDEGESSINMFSCMNTVNRWHRKACAEMFPPLKRNHDISTEESDVGVKGDEEKRSDAVRGSKEGYAVGGVNDGGRGEEKQRHQHGTTTAAGGGRGETIVREAAATTPLLTVAADTHTIVSFEEATRQVNGTRRDLNDLLRAIKVHVAPKQDRRNYFLAHHFPFFQAQADPLTRERGLLDQIAIIEGYSLSEVDFNRLALAFSCLLSDAGAGTGTGGDAAEEDGGERRGNNPSSEFRINEEEEHEQEGVSEARRVAGGNREISTSSPPVVLRTTAAEEEGLQAVVDCSLVDSLHDVWMSLLENKFEPPETVCRGPSGPCLQRALKESISSSVL